MKRGDMYLLRHPRGGDPITFRNMTIFPLFGHPSCQSRPDRCCSGSPRAGRSPQRFCNLT